MTIRDPVDQSFIWALIEIEFFFSNLVVCLRIFIILQDDEKSENGDECLKLLL